jgi:protein gp37
VEELMGANSGIEWTHHTFNPWRGCTRVSPGCQHCYAEQMSGRNPAVLGVWGPRGARAIAAESYWRQPLRWNAEAEQAGERRRVFCASLADVFEGYDTMPERSRPYVGAARQRLWNLISETEHLDWLLLTKRPENMRRMLPADFRADPWPNVWLGASAENQEWFDKRINALLGTPARAHFLSVEPMLGPIDIRGYRPSWVICGGESGPQARLMQLEWARSLRDQCLGAGIPFFFKQWGEYVPQSQAPVGTPEPSVGPRSRKNLEAFEQSFGKSSNAYWHVGKKAAGRKLDDREWNEYPR